MEYAGKGGNTNPGIGGSGAKVTGSISVIAGQTLYITVGANGSNWVNSNSGAGGGGYSSISTTSLTSGPYVIAGAGGGAGYDATNGGNAGTSGGSGGGAGGNNSTGADGGTGSTGGAATGGGGAGGASGTSGSAASNAGGGGGGGFGFSGGAGSTGSGGILGGNGGVPGGGQGGYDGAGGGGGYGGGGGGNGTNGGPSGGGGGGGGSSLIPAGAIAVLSTVVAPYVTLSGSVAPAPTVNLSTASLAINATTLTIDGTGFDTTAGNNTVGFNLGAVGTVSAATATQLTVTFTTPPTSTGSLTAVVTTNGQNSGSPVQVATVVLATQATLSVVPTPSSINVNGTSTLSTTGGSGSGAVTNNLVSGPCNLSGATLTGTGAGSCLVTATKAADSTYASATSSQVTVAVSLAPVDCVVSSWTAFGACSASCGGGTQTQTRTVITPASNGGAACPALSQSQACNVQACQSQASGTAPGGSGAINATIGSGGSFISTQFTAPTNPPSGQSFPYGVFGFTAATNTLGGSITITLTYPQALAAGTKVFKDINGTWLNYTSNVTFNQSRTTITYSVVDGGPFDSDGVANQSVTDPIGPTITALSTSSAVPSLSEWTQLMLGLMVMATLGWHWNRERSY